MERSYETPFLKVDDQEAIPKPSRPRVKALVAGALVGGGLLLGLCAAGSAVSRPEISMRGTTAFTLAAVEPAKSPTQEKEDPEEEKKEEEEKEEEKEEEEKKAEEKPAQGAAARRHPPGSRMFLHIADSHADPFYDYTQYFVPAEKVSRSPLLYSNKEPAKECGWDTPEKILEHWNRTGGGPSCPCGQFGANPPFSVLASLREKMEELSPEFVIWSGDFASHYLPGTNANDTCKTAKAAVKATVTLLNARGKGEKPIEHLWGWGNNDVLPKRAPVTQEWLEELGHHMLKEGWLKEHEMKDWNQGGFYRRHLNRGLCIIVLNSNSWTANQINEEHHANQLKWFQTEAFSAACHQYIINAHVPLGWLEGGQGHHEWENLKGAEVPNYSTLYRRVIEEHSAKIIAELYGHINKADIRLMTGDRKDVEDAPAADPLGDIDENIGDTDDDGEAGADVDTNAKDKEVEKGNDKGVVSFTVAGISRRGLNDPQFQKIMLHELGGTSEEKDFSIADIDVYAMRRGCEFEFAYSFRDLFKPHFDYAINETSLKAMVADETQRKAVESHLSMSCAPYPKTIFKDPKFMESVRKGEGGCDCKAEVTKL